MHVRLKNYFSTAVEDIELRDGFAKELDPSKFTGFFATLGDRCIGLASLDRRLFIIVDKQLIEVNSELAVNLETVDQRRRLDIKSGHLNYTVEYRKEHPISTPFYSEDEEDADFGLWLCNNLSSAERQLALAEHWATCKPTAV